MMKFYIVFFLVFVPFTMFSQWNYSENDGNPRFYASGYINHEEICFLQPESPGQLKKVWVYLAGGQINKLDTMRFVNDATNWNFNTYWVTGFFKYSAFTEVTYLFKTTGWYEFDLEKYNIQIGGINSVGVSHIIDPGDGIFAMDGDSLTYPHSWVNDVFTQNGQIYKANGDYLIRAEIDFTYGSKDAEKPEAQLVDVSKEAGLVNEDGSFLKFTNASVVDWNKDGYDDIAIGGKFFENNGDGTFEEVSKKLQVNARNTVWGDLDNDGNLDFYVASDDDRDMIYWGDGHGGFQRNTDIDFEIDQPSMGVVFLDYDKDGLLDIFVSANRRTINDEEVYYPDQLFRNLGNKEFENVTAQSGIAAGEPSPYYDCYGANVVDYNNDGYPDIFVPTYRLAPDLLYKNNGDGTFDEVGRESMARGVGTVDTTSFGHGMGADWVDYDNNGFVDLCIGNLAHPDVRGAFSNPSLVMRNTGFGTFENKTKEVGLKHFEMNAAPTWIDLDNDGDYDLFSSQYSYTAKGEEVDRYSRLYMNQGVLKKNKLVDMTWDYSAEVHGAWTALRIDYDRDGDLDLLVCSDKENVKLFRNDLEDIGNFASFHLDCQGIDGVNSDGYGSEVKLYLGSKVYMQQLAGTRNNGRTGQSSDVIHYGIGEENEIGQVEIKFPDGRVNIYSDVVSNLHYDVGYEMDTLPKVTNLVLPLDEAVSEDAKIILSWEELENIDAYNVELTKDSEFKEGVQSHYVRTKDTFFLADNVDGSEEYFWRVRGYNLSGRGAWSEVRSFSLIATIYSELISPENGASNVAARTNFEWSEVDGSEYIIEIYDDENGVSPIFSSTVSEPSYIGDLAENTEYWWRVMPIKNGFNSEWSERYSFLTEDLVETVLISPENYSENVLMALVDFEWSLSAPSKGGLLELSDSKDFINITNKINIDENMTEVQAGNLDEDAEYFWRINTYNQNGNGQYSDVWMFRTENLIEVTLIHPENNGGLGLDDFISWEADGTPEKFEFQVSDDSLFSNLVEEGETAADVKHHELKKLEPETLYFWRVRGLNINGNGNWSSIFQFATPTDCSVNEVFINNYNLQFLSENPTNGEIFFSLDCKAPSNIGIEITDIHGKPVLRLNENNLGLKSFNFDISEYDIGTYYLNIKIGDDSFNKKIMLIE